MKYLLQHYDTYYYRRKLQNVPICLSLKTKNILEAQYILSIINSKIELLRYSMNFEEEIDFIKSFLKRYIDVAKDEYSEFAFLREQKYKFTKPNGKTVLGSHPLAIENAMEDLQDSVYSSDKKEVAENIISISNISKEEFQSAVTKLSERGKQRLLDEVIKAEIELLSFDKERNEQRTSIEKITPTYISRDNATTVSKTNEITQLNNIMSVVNAIQEDEKSKYKIKTKYEVFEEYFEQEKETKANLLDKFVLPIKTLLKATEKEYFIDYDIKDFERFFQALIYTPSRINQKKDLYLSYEEDYVSLAEDFKDYLEGEENTFIKFETKYKFGLQSVSNVKEKLGEMGNFIRFCIQNNYLDHDYFTNNSKFSAKRFQAILKGQKQREPFNGNELKNIFTVLEHLIEKNGFCAEEVYITLIGFYSGMRVEEIAKLKTEDIKEEEGIYYFDINGEVKTTDSVRKVPVHNDLVDKFRFLFYVESRRKNNIEQLFDLKTIQRKKKLKYSHYYLRDFFSDFRDNCVEAERIENNLISFHSFRHAFATRLLQNRVEFYSISALLGHKVDSVLKNLLQTRIKKNETARYAHNNDLSNLKEDINKLYLSDIESNIESLAKAVKSSIKF